MAIHSSILVWRIPWTEESVHRVAKSWTRLKRLGTLGPPLTVAVINNLGCELGLLVVRETWKTGLPSFNYKCLPFPEPRVLTLDI